MWISTTSWGKILFMDDFSRHYNTSETLASSFEKIAGLKINIL